MHPCLHFLFQTQGPQGTHRRWLGAVLWPVTAQRSVCAQGCSEERRRGSHRRAAFHHCAPSPQGPSLRQVYLQVEMNMCPCPTNPRSRSVSSTFFLPLLYLGLASKQFQAFFGLSCYSLLELSAAARRWPLADGGAELPSKCCVPFPIPPPPTHLHLRQQRPCPGALAPAPCFLPPSLTSLHISAAAFVFLQKLLRRE